MKQRSESDKKYNNSPAGQARTKRFEQTPRRRKSARERARSIYWRKKSQGICVTVGCHEGAIEGRTLCEFHKKLRAEQDARYKLFGTSKGLGGKNGDS